MRSKNILLISALLLLSADISLANYDKTISIAIITDKTSDLSKSPIVSLLEVELSQKEDLQILERAEIDKIMEEQRLSAAGLLDRNTTVKIDKILRADAFLILSLESRIQDANDLIRVRFAETAHGLRLLDYFEQPENSNPKEAIERIVQKIESVLNKLKQPDEKLIPVGIVDIHRVELGEKYKILERTLPTILSVRLSLEPQIIMLEREDLKVLLDEKLRTEGEYSKFWNSAVLIDGYLQSNKGQLAMHLNLKQSDGVVIKSLILPVEPNEPTNSIDTAVTEIIQKLQDSPPTGRWNPKLEAEQFYKQGQMLANHKRNDETIPLFETAYALEPNNVFYTGAMFARIWDIRRKIDETLINNEIGIAKYEEPGICPYSDMEIVDMVSILVRQTRDSFKNGLISTRQIFYSLSEALGRDFMTSQGYFSSRVSVETTPIRQINRENRKIWTDTFGEALRHQAIDSSYPPMNNYVAVRLAYLSSDDPNELLVNLKKVFNEYIMPPELGGKISSESERKHIYKQSIAIIFNDIISLNHLNQRTHLQNSGEVFLKHLKLYLEELSSINDSVVSVQSKLLLSQDFQIFLNDLRHELKTSKPNDNNYNSEAMEELFNKIYYRFNYREMEVDEMMDIWDEFSGYIIDSNDINTLASLFLNGTKSSFTRILEIVDRIVDSPSFNRNGTGKEKRFELYQRCNLLLTRISQKLQSNVNNNRIKASLNNIRSIQVEIERQFPELAVKKEKPFEVTMLLAQKDWPEKVESTFIHTLFRIRWLQIDIQNKTLWIAMGLHNKLNGNTRAIDNVGFVGINLEQHKVFVLWQSPIPPYDSDSEIKSVTELTDVVISNQTSFISFYGGGILEFPGSLTEGRKYFNNLKMIRQSDGLPSLLITSMAKEENSLWVAYGGRNEESGLGLYDPNTGIWETVLCSTLNNNPPFSDGQSYTLYSLLRINPNKVFFNTYDTDQVGLWRLNTDSQELNYLGPVGKYSRSPSGDIIDGQENKLLLKLDNYLAEFDTDSENVKVLYGNAHGLRREYSDFGLNPPDYDKEATNINLVKDIKFGMFTVQGALDLSTGTIHSNKIWARLGPNQIAIIEKGKNFEEAQIIDNNILDGEPVHRFVSTPYGLVAIGEGAVGLIETETVEK